MSSEGSTNSEKDNPLALQREKKYGKGFTYTQMKFEEASLILCAQGDYVSRPRRTVVFSL